MKRTAILRRCLSRRDFSLSDRRVFERKRETANRSYTVNPPSVEQDSVHH